MEALFSERLQEENKITIMQNDGTKLIFINFHTRQVVGKIVLYLFSGCCIIIRESIDDFSSANIYLYYSVVWIIQELQTVCVFKWRIRWKKQMIIRD